MDDLSAVPGVTAADTDGVLKQQLVSGQLLGSQRGGGRSADRRRPAAAGDQCGSAGALAAMLVYIAFRFEWIYGVAAVIAVFHDTIITIGLFSIFNKQIDLTVIAALLTLGWLFDERHDRDLRPYS